MVLEVGKDIVKWIHIKKSKPYLPVWGQLFYILYQIKRSGDTQNQIIVLYHVNNRLMTYDPTKKKFCLEVEGNTFRLTAEELTTAILKSGAFLLPNHTKMWYNRPIIIRAIMGAPFRKDTYALYDDGASFMSY